MFSRLKSATLPAFALLGLFLSGCDPKIANALYQPYHDPFDTTRAVGFSPIPTPEATELQQILNRSTPREKNSGDVDFTPGYLPFGTISVEAEVGKKETCICHDHRIECDGEREFDIGPKDVAAYRSLMKRIDSLDHARRGVEKRPAPPVSIPDVPVN